MEDEVIDAPKRVRKPSRQRLIEKFIMQFPEDTDMWQDATDEIMDIAREIREKVNDINDVIEGDEGYIDAIDFRKFTNPGKRNKAYKTQIRELWPKLTTEMKDEILLMIHNMGI